MEYDDDELALGFQISPVIDGNDLINKNREIFLRKTGNLPISELTEKRLMERAQHGHVETQDSGDPHYLQRTSSMNTRDAWTLNRFSTTLRDRVTMREEKSTSIPNHKIKRKKHDPLSLPELLENEAVIKSMNTKLAYLRNPRNDPTAVTKMLTKPFPTTSYVSKSQPPTRASQAAVVTDAPLFLAEPKRIEFYGFQVGQTLTQMLKFRNHSSTSRSFRVSKPQTPQFSTSQLKYPPQCSAGYVAPGVAITTVVTFVPDARKDFYDSITVETEGGSYVIPMVAKLDAPILSLPPELDLGICLIGDSARVSFRCLNTGGGESFRLMMKDVYVSQMSDSSLTSSNCLRSYPFTIYPTSFTLETNEEVGIVIEYLPRHLGLHRCDLVIVYGDNQVLEYSVVAQTRSVDISVVEINSVAIEAEISKHPELRRDLFFDGNPVGTEQIQRIVITNDTGIPLEYEWIWAPTNVEGDEKFALVQLHNHPEAGFTDRSKPTTSPTELTFEDVLLKSHTFGRDMDGGQNSAESKQFSITPARGVLSSDPIMSASFDVTFIADSLAMVKKNVFLIIKSIPLLAVPNALQAHGLTDLANTGHMKFHKLRSWLADMGEEIADPDGGRHQLRVVTLRTLLDLATRHFDRQDEDAEVELRSLLWRSRLAVLHTYIARDERPQITAPSLFQSKSLSVYNDISKGSATDQRYPHFAYESELVRMLDWKVRNGTEGPSKLPPLDLPASSFYWTEHPAVNAEDDDVEDEEEAVSRCQHYLDELFVDEVNGLAFLGPTICACLNDKVEHEAIDYLQEHIRTAAPCLSMMVSGVAIGQRVISTPPQLFVGGAISIGTTWTGGISLSNESGSMSEIEIAVHDIKVTSFHELEAGEEEGEIKYLSFFKVEAEPPRILLMPHSSSLIQLSVTANISGKFELFVPIRSPNAFTDTESVTIIVKVKGPHIRLESPEVDVGLICVGGEESKRFSFTNEGEVPLSFLLKVYQDTDDDPDSPKKSRSAAGSQLGSTQSSRQPSARDFDSPSRDSGSFFIENPTVLVLIEPPSGTVQPRETVSVKLRAKAGKAPQRIRGLIECLLYNISGAIQLPSQIVALRGEVQSPKTILYPMIVDLKHVFVGAPVKFQVTVENMCNIPAKYKLERPGSEPTSFRLSYDKPRGDLDQKEKVIINGEFTALAATAFDEVLACKIFGVKVPLGFTLAATSKDIALEFSQLLEGQTVPKPLAKISDTQYMGGLEAPEPNPLDSPINFGDDVPLFERRVRRVVIRNFSAVGAPFTLFVRKLVATMKPKSKYARNSNSDSPTKSVTTIVTEEGEVIEVDDSRKDLILAPHEEGADKFRSAGGKKYVLESSQRREDTIYLASHLGASFVIEPAAGQLAPWGVQVVTIRAFNDVPGVYEDDLICSVQDGRGNTQESVIPLHMVVTGCPVQIERDCVGMSLQRHIVNSGQDTSDDREGASWLLHMGTACVHSDQLTRIFRVSNKGSKPVAIEWSIRKNNLPNAKGPMKVKFKIAKRSMTGDPNDASSMKTRVTTHIRLLSDVLDETAFVVDPAKAIVEPYSKKVFTVHLSNTDDFGIQDALISGNISFLPTANPATKSVEGSHSVSLQVPPGFMVGLPETPSVLNLNTQTAADITFAPPPSPNDNLPSTDILPPLSSSFSGDANNDESPAYQIQLAVRGVFVFPVVRLGPASFAAKDNPTVLSKESAIVLSAQAPLFYSNSSSTGTGDACSQILTFINPQACTIAFSSTTDGPFTIRDPGLDNSESKIAKKQTTISTVGKMSYLLPNESTTFKIVFTPRRDLRSKLLHPRKDSDTDSAEFTITGNMVRISGKLILTFSTGQSLHIPLIVELSTPFVSLSSPVVTFGVCHINQSVNGSTLLSNLTDVSASWSVAHVPGAGSTTTPSTIIVPGFQPIIPATDDPSVFEIFPSSGSLDGPTLSPASAVAAPPKDVIRRSDLPEIAPQRLVETSWASSTLNLHDSLKKRYESSQPSDGGGGATLMTPITLNASLRSVSQGEPVKGEKLVKYPLPLRVTFKPRKNVEYSSRFRFTSDFGNSFDVLLQGRGTYEEQEHAPIYPKPS